MPYVSLKQEKYFNANRSKLEKQGVNVDEFNQASKGKKLPMKAPKQQAPAKVKPAVSPKTMAQGYSKMK